MVNAAFCRVSRFLRVLKNNINDELGSQDSGFGARVDWDKVPYLSCCENALVAS